MSDVYIAYSPENRDAAQILADLLTDKNYSVNWDRDVSQTGSSTEPIDTAKAIIVIWSDASRHSQYVRLEAAIGRDRNRLLPVCIDTKPLPQDFDYIHTLSLNGWDGMDESALDDIFQGLDALIKDPDDWTPTAYEPYTASRFPLMFAGVNARPNQKPVAEIETEEKRQRTFRKTFWLTSLGLAVAIALVLGLSVGYETGFSGLVWVVRALTATFMIASGLIIGRLFIMTGRRMAKRKSVQYFDLPTLIALIGAIVSAALVFTVLITRPSATDPILISESVIAALLFGLVMVFPALGLASLVLGAARGRKRTSFADD